MRRYGREEENRIRLRSDVREWTRAGLLDASQAASIDAQLRTDLRQTNLPLRVALALFTVVIAESLVALIMKLLDVHRPGEMAAVSAACAVGYLALADRAVVKGRLYRHGVEEALTASAVILAAIAAAEAATVVGVPRPWGVVAALAAASAVASGAYVRFGFVYAAIAAMAFATIVPFQFDFPPGLHRLTAAALLAIVFTIARASRRAADDDAKHAEYGAIEAAAWAGVYAVLNVHLLDVGNVKAWTAPAGSLFYWTTYAATWIMPAAGLLLAVRERERWFVAVNAVMAIATVVTSKPYLGWPRQTWDPIAFGLALIVTAIAVRRWLARGPDGQRGAFTAASITGRDRDALTLLANASAFWTPPGQVAHGPAAPTGFDGGRSGGGGASGSY